MTRDSQKAGFFVQPVAAAALPAGIAAPFSLTCRMRLAKLIIALLIVAVIAVGAWRLLDNPTKRITQRFDALAALISTEQPDPPIQLAVKAQSLQAFFTDPAQLLTPVMGLAGALPAADIAAQTMLARGMFTTIRLRFTDLQITLAGPDAATASLTALLDGTLTSGDRLNEVRELRCELLRADGEWRFAACEVVEVLQR